MTNKLLLCFCAALLLTGCSDSGNTAVETPNTATGDLSEIRTLHYESGIQYTTVDNYTDGYLTHTDYVQSGSVTWFKDYTYNAQGLMSTYLETTDFGTHTRKQVYTYDTTGRLIKTVFYVNGTADFQMTYDYTPGLITPTVENFETGNITTGDRYFYVNSNGVIYKEYDNRNSIEDIYEVDYDGYNPISSYNFNVYTYFTFDNTHDYSLLGINDGNGNFKANGVLRNDWLQNYEAAIANKFILSSERDPDGEYPEILTYTYEFAENGKPISREEKLNGAPLSQTEYIYE